MNPRTSLIIAVVALLVGAAGVYVGIDARNNSDDAKDAADEAKSQLESELSSAESQAESQLKETAKTEQGELESAGTEAAGIADSVRKLESQVATLNQNSDRQSGEIQTLIEELNKLDARVTKLQDQN